MLPALNELAQRPELISIQEANRLGIETALRMRRLRGKAVTGCWGHCGGGSCHCGGDGSTISPDTVRVSAAVPEKLLNS